MIHVLVAVFNRKEMTQQFLEALRKQTYREFRVVLVDDGSTDGTGDMIRKGFPEVDLVSGDGSLWWTGSMKVGQDHILETAKPGDFILCANNDQIADPGAIEALVKASEKYGRAIVGSIAKERKNPENLYDAAYSLDWKKVRYTRVEIREKGELAEGIDVLTCRFTIVPIEAFGKIGFDSESFPHYLGDYDLFLQAKRAGYRLVLSYDSVVYDIGGPSGIYSARKDLGFKELYDQMVSVRSHANVRFMTRYVMKNCPSALYKAKYLATTALRWGYLFARAAATAPRRLASSR